MKMKQDLLEKRTNQQIGEIQDKIAVAKEQTQAEIAKCSLSHVSTSRRS